MPDWKQWIGIYVALIIGGLASIHTHFIEYIVILLVSLGLLGITTYNAQKELHEYQARELGHRKVKP